MPCLLCTNAHVWEGDQHPSPSQDSLLHPSLDPHPQPSTLSSSPTLPLISLLKHYFLLFFYLHFIIYYFLLFLQLSFFLFYSMPFFLKHLKSLSSNNNKTWPSCFPLALQTANISLFPGLLRYHRGTTKPIKDLRCQEASFSSQGNFLS